MILLLSRRLQSSGNNRILITIEEMPLANGSNKPNAEGILLCRYGRDKVLTKYILKKIFQLKETVYFIHSVSNLRIYLCLDDTVSPLGECAAPVSLNTLGLLVPISLIA